MSCLGAKNGQLSTGDPRCDPQPSLLPCRLLLTISEACMAGASAPVGHGSLTGWLRRSGLVDVVNSPVRQDLRVCPGYSHLLHAAFWG